MRSTDDIEKLLSEIALPGLRDGAHRVALKRELIAQMQSKERPMAEEPRQNGGDLALATRTNPWRRIMRPQWIALAAVIAVVATIVVGKQASDRAGVSPPELAHVAASDSSGAAGALAVQPSSTSNLSVAEELAKRSLRDGSRELVLQRRSLEQCVADAEVIVVATALDSAPAPPKRPGDHPEVLIRFRVARVLKGKLAEEVITTRTPTSAAEFIGKEWVILLSPEYMAGNHQFADCYWIKGEPEVKAILAKAKK